jgi:AcrR family transcriptional regulator
VDEDRVSESGPEVPPPPWQRLPSRPGRRRRDPISRDAIVAAAIELLDRDGFEALSMRGLAEQLGTGAASLYWHVGSKEGLLDLVFDQNIGEVEVPPADPARWAEQIREVARAQRAVSLRHPYIVRLSIGRIPMGPNAIRLTERVVGIMLAGGVPPGLAVQGYLLLIAAVNGFTMDETGVGEGGGAVIPAEAQARQEQADQASGYLKSLPPEHFPHLVALADEFGLADNEERFELLIDIFADGLARRSGAAQNGPA